jgi:hypothetical protein
MTAAYMRSWPDICRVPCGHCGQPEGAFCRTPKGQVTQPHGSRREDAAARGFYVPGRGSLVDAERET